MIERAYTVSEIIRMRAAVAMLLTTYPTINAAAGSNAKIEEQLRTYMTAGVGPEGLEAAANEHEEKLWRALERTMPGGGIGT